MLPETRIMLNGSMGHSSKISQNFAVGDHGKDGVVKVN